MAVSGKSSNRRQKDKKSGYKRKDKSEIVARLSAAQRGRCKSCGGKGTLLGDGTAGLVLDHCHRTGKARAMLCTHCNIALGMLMESPEKIKALLRYAQSLAQASIAC